MMANESNIDSWKIGLDCTESGSSNSRRKFAVIDARTDETFQSVNHHVPTRGSKSSPEIRRINPAIYTESVDEKEHSVAQMQFDRKQEGYHNGHAIDVNHGDCKSSTTDQPAVRSIAKDVDRADERPTMGRDTYRCYTMSVPDTALSLESFTDRSAASSRLTARVEQRCKIDSVSENVYRSEAVKREKYILDNRQVVRISTTSLSSTSITDCQVSNGSDLARRIAHSEWMRKKHKDAQRKREKEERAAKWRQEEKERIAREKEEKARLEEENYLKWKENKKRQELDRKAMLENVLELQKRLKEMEDKAAVAKTLYLRQWHHKKEEDQKTRHNEQKMKQKKMNEEREKRLEQSSKAYEKWKENSKNKPKPATQGLLPHQKAKPSYINPIPWQPIMEINSDEEQEQENIFNEINGNINQLEINDDRIIVAHQ